MKTNRLSQANNFRYLRRAGRGQCLGTGTLEARKTLENGAESPASGARFVGLPLRNSQT